MHLTGVLHSILHSQFKLENVPRLLKTTYRVMLVYYILHVAVKLLNHLYNIVNWVGCQFEKYICVHF